MLMSYLRRGATLNPEEVPDRLPTSILKLFWLIIRPLAWVFLFQYVFAMALRGLVQAQFYGLKEMTDAVLAHVPGTDIWQTLAGPFQILLLVMVCIILFDWMAWFTSYHGRINALARGRALIFRYVHNHDPLYFDDNLTGKVAYRTMLLPDQINTLYEKSVWDYSTFIMQTVLVIFFAAQASYLFAALLLLWVAAYLGFALLFAKRIARAGLKHSEAKAHLTGAIVDSITNIRNVILFAGHKTENSQVTKYVDETRKAQRHQYLEFVKMRVPVVHGMMAVVICGLLPLLINELGKGSITVGSFVLIVALVFNMLRTLSDLSNSMPETFDLIGSIRDCINTLVVDRHLTDKVDAKALQVSHGQIDFNGVSFSYENGQRVFDGLELHIPAGQRVGLVGASGAGKSTLISLLMRMNDVQAGSVCIDGQAVDAVAQTSLRRQIGVIPQDSILFHRSIFENIRYGRMDATREEVEQAARKAHAHDFIMALPKGYDTMVGERGVKLSGGQRQRIAVARAILKNAPILLLDEATSALDSESEAAIQSSMADLMVGKTVIAIAHRLSTIASLNRLIVMDQGRIVEDGSHDELLRKGGYYAKLWAHQSGGFLKEEAVFEA